MNQYMESTHRAIQAAGRICAHCGMPLLLNILTETADDGAQVHNGCLLFYKPMPCSPLERSLVSTKAGAA